MTNYLRQVIVINSDLKMSRGKIAVSAAHGTTLYMRSIEKILISEESEWDEEYLNIHESWMSDGTMMKIAFKASEHEMTEILEEWSYGYRLFPVRDFGFTQVPSNSLTCIASEPISKEVSDEIFGHLKLL
jgi:PTH2 family peptidyl-tRNA hydrolase